ncbi:MAG: helix-turn-helix domain-containing protein [Bacteroidales bacterium]|nr:helix-turn-helix domain-containing protein [Bacteroidales bacterium]
MTSKRDTIRAWLMYYWRSLFYTSAPTRKKIEERANNRTEELEDYIGGEVEDIDEEMIADAVADPELFQGAVDDELAQKFFAIFQRTHNPIVFLVAPIRVRRNEDGNKMYEYFPFWFPLEAQFNEHANKWSIKCNKFFHDIYVPRKFMTPQAGEDDYVNESEFEFTFTTCEKYEQNYAIPLEHNMSLDQYIDAIKESFRNMTGQTLDSYTCKETGLIAEYNPFIHIERPNDFTKKIRRLYRENLQLDEVCIPQLIQSLIAPNNHLSHYPINDITDDYLESGKLHLGQMNNKYPLSSSQRKALLTWLKYESVDDIMVVNGPPGTGKTTLIQSIIASKIVQSAIEADKPYMALCCASTHKAVTNIIDSFNGSNVSNIRYLPDFTGYASYVSRDNDLTKKFFHFPPNSSKKFRKGPFPPGNGDRPGIETEEYRNNAKEAYLNHFDDYDSLSNVIEKLHGDVIYSIKRICAGIDAVLNYLYDNNSSPINDWWLVCQKDRGYMPFSENALNLNLEDENIEERFQQLLDVTYRYSAFVSSIRYWEARWLNDARFSDEGPGNKEEKARMLQQKAMLTPCFVTTLHSSVSLFSFIQDGELFPLYSMADCLILDEAGQTLPEIGSAAFSFAKKAIVFGDTQQLEPIHGLHPKLDIGDLIQSNIPCSEDDIQLYKSRNMLSSSGNMVGFAQSACNIIENESLPGQRGIMLVEHRRCRKEIIDYCNQLVYKGLLSPQTTERKNYLYPPFSFIPVNGPSTIPLSNSSRINESEADAIVQWINNEKPHILNEYADRYSSIEEIIAIVTPFKAQEKILNSKLSEIGINTIATDSGIEGTRTMVVGTVHKLQGAQAPIVIFSSVYGSNDYQMRFIDTKPNMLNVAVSRAQDAFIVFGDANLYHRSVLKYYRDLLSGHFSTPVPTGLLKVYCNRYDASTPFYFDSMLEFRLSASGNRPREECTDGEKMLIELLNELKIPYYLHVPLSKVYMKLVNMAEASILNDNELSFVLETDSHYDFLVSIDTLLLAIEVDGGKHKEDKQAYRDGIKDSLSKKLGIDILRLPTDTLKSKDEIKRSVSSFIISSLPGTYSKDLKSWEVSHSMYVYGLSVEEIAQTRGLQLNTVNNHLAQAIINRRMSVNDLFSDNQVLSMTKAVKSVLQEGMTIGDIYRALNGELDYYMINIALSLID